MRSKYPLTYPGPSPPLGTQVRFLCTNLPHLNLYRRLRVGSRMQFSSRIPIAPAGAKAESYPALCQLFCSGCPCSDFQGITAFLLALSGIGRQDRFVRDPHGDSRSLDPYRSFASRFRRQASLCPCHRCFVALAGDRYVRLALCADTHAIASSEEVGEPPDRSRSGSGVVTCSTYARPSSGKSASRGAANSRSLSTARSVIRAHYLQSRPPGTGPFGRLPQPPAT